MLLYYVTQFCCDNLIIVMLQLSRRALAALMLPHFHCLITHVGQDMAGHFYVMNQYFSSTAITLAVIITIFGKWYLPLSFLSSRLLLILLKCVTFPNEIVSLISVCYTTAWFLSIMWYMYYYVMNNTDSSYHDLPRQQCMLSAFRWYSVLFSVFYHLTYEGYIDIERSGYYFYSKTF